MQKFPDLSSAGRDLANQLQEFNRRLDTIVLALVAGGAPVASEVAKCLHLPLEVLLIRRLLAPRGPVDPICVVNIAGTEVVQDELPPQPTIPTSGLDHSIADGLTDLARRAGTCRGNRPPMEIFHKTVLLVDNGIHTGSTVLSATRALRKLEPAQIIVAVPVAAPECREAVELAADRVVCLAWPERFGHVGLWYVDFTRPNDEQIRQLLDHSDSNAELSARSLRV